MAEVKTRRPWRSGFCGIGNPRQGHTHCRMWNDQGSACCCECHTSPWPVEPLVWDGDSA